MTRFLILFLLALPLWGQGTVYDISASVKDRAVAWYFRITPEITTDAIRCFYDYDNVVLDRRSRQSNSGGDVVGGNNAGRRHMTVYDLAPDDDVYFSCHTSDSTKTLWSLNLTCPVTCDPCTGSSDDASADPDFFATDTGGVKCTLGEFPRFHTATEDTDPTPTAPTSNALLTPPTPTVAAINVASDCSDWDTQFTAAKAEAADGDVVELLVPSGTTCALAGNNGLVFTPIANDGWVIIRTDVDAKLVPPAGAMIDKTYLPFLAKFTLGGPSTSSYTPWAEAAASGRGYYFMNVEIGPPEFGSSLDDPIDITVIGIDTTTNILTASATVNTNLRSGQTVVVDLAGTGVLGAQGIAQICAISGATFKLGTSATSISTAGAGCTATLDLVGTYTSGGSVRRYVSLPIESWQDCSDGVQCATSTGHKIPQLIDMPITGGTAGSITVTGTPAQYMIGTDTTATALAGVVHIEGTGQANCDGLRDVTAASAGVISVTRSGQATDCSAATTGTVHGHRAYSLAKSNITLLGDKAGPQAHNIEIEDANTIRFLEVPVQTGASGGYLFGDQTRENTMVVVSQLDGVNPPSDITFDRVIMRACANETAHWLTSTFQLAGTDSALINSWIESCPFFRRNPVNGSDERVHGDFQSFGALSFQGAQAIVVDNNYGLIRGMGWFADFDYSSPITSVDNFRYSRNYLWNPDWAVASAGSFRNHYFHGANGWEIKSPGNAGLYSGNFTKGFVQNFNGFGPIIFISLIGSKTTVPNGIRNWSFENNIAWRGGGSFLNVSESGPSSVAAALSVVSENIRIANNLAVGTDNVKYRGGSDNGIGQFLYITAAMRDVVATRNTYGPERCDECSVLQAGSRKGTGMRMTDNIMVFNQGSNSNRSGVRTQSTNAEVPINFTGSDGGKDLFDLLYWRGTATDVGQTSQYGGTGDENIHIPGIENSFTGTYATKAASLLNADTVCADELYTKSNMSNLDTGNTTIGAAGACSGNNVDTLNDRLNMVFESGTWVPKAAYSTKGADIAALADAQGLPGPVTVTADDNQFDLSFHAPSNTECTIDRAPWAGTWATTWDNAADITRGATANGATQTKTFSATGLSAETQYAYRGFCAGKGFIGLVTTAGAP